MMEGKQKVSVNTRRLDIPAPVMWLRYDDDPASKPASRVDNGPVPGGLILATLVLIPLVSYAL